jgi:predicted dehydrogenase
MKPSETHTNNCPDARETAPESTSELVPPPMSRRRFLGRTSSFAVGLMAAPSLIPTTGAEAPSNKLLVGVMGVSRNSAGGDGRGAELAVGFASLPGVEVAYVCDVDERNVPKAIESVMKRGKQSRTPKGVGDFRRIIEDKAVDALVIATPAHWHAPAAILGCLTGKHVYVEKPCSHNAHEAELLAMAARKYNRRVQHGTQRRSWPALREAVEKIHAGEIGRVLLAKSWYLAQRPSIGKGSQVQVPSWLDYALWQGPAPERPFRDNVVHYNWHWFWHWGTGELGNNGVHYIDVCRWALGVDYPLRITSSGGKYRYPDDDQETPDTNIVSYDFGGATITWEQRSWASRTPQDPQYEMAFYGDKGMLTIQGGSYTIYDEKGKERGKGTGPGGNQTHLQNFIDAIREGKELNAEIVEGYKSTLLSHLGNIAYRTGRAIQFDPQARRIVGDKAALKHWGREYNKEWQPKI